MRRGFAVPKLRRCNSKTHPILQACSSCASFLLTSCEDDAKDFPCTESYRRDLVCCFCDDGDAAQTLGAEQENDASSMLCSMSWVVFDIVCEIGAVAPSTLRSQLCLSPAYVRSFPKRYV